MLYPLSCHIRADEQPSSVSRNAAHATGFEARPSRPADNSATSRFLSLSRARHDRTQLRPDLLPALRAGPREKPQPGFVKSSYRMARNSADGLSSAGLGMWIAWPWKPWRPRPGAAGTPARSTARGPGSHALSSPARSRRQASGSALAVPGDAASRRPTGAVHDGEEVAATGPRKRGDARLATVRQACQPVGTESRASGAPSRLSSGIQGDAEADSRGPLAVARSTTGRPSTTLEGGRCLSSCRQAEHGRVSS
jgi:hypothetical protein